jgi:hypothetical protein
MYYGRSIGHDIKSNAVASELILPTAFETAQCRFPKINRGRETTLRCQYRLWCGRGAVCTGDRNLDVARTLLAHCLIATVDICNLNKGVTACKKARLRDRICPKKPKFCLFLAQHQLTLTCWSAIIYFQYKWRSYPNNIAKLTIVSNITIIYQCYIQLERSPSSGPTSQTAKP